MEWAHEGWREAKVGCLIQHCWWGEMVHCAEHLSVVHRKICDRWFGV